MIPVSRAAVVIMISVLAVATSVLIVYGTDALEAPSSCEVSEGSYIEWEFTRTVEGRDASVESHTVRGVVSDVRPDGRFTLDIYIDGEPSDESLEGFDPGSLILSDDALERLSERSAGYAMLDTFDGEAVCSVYTVWREREGCTETDTFYIGGDSLVHRFVRQCDRWDGFEVTEVTLVGTDMVRSHRRSSEFMGRPCPEGGTGPG